jgi:hypothetical protein
MPVFGWGRVNGNSQVLTLREVAVSKDSRSGASWFGTHAKGALLTMRLGPQRLLEIRDQIFLVLDADRQPHDVGPGA